MPVNVILDKSTFQSLSYTELIMLNRYYKSNITPVLTMEILGDLKKEAKEGRALPTDRVSDFARKLFPHTSVVNAHFTKMLKTDLVDGRIEIDGRPFLDIAKTVSTGDGQKGWLVKETAEEKSIIKWKEGNFEEADYELSKLWRDTTTQHDILIKLKSSLAELKGDKKIKNFDELAAYIEGIISNSVSQQSLLLVIMEYYGFNPTEGFKVMQRWAACGRPLLKDFAPYATYCLKVNLLFHIGLVHDLIHTRPTNKVDLEYLYYLPFCDVFSSNDKIHFNLIPHLLRDDQLFIAGPDLKADLKMISDHIDSLDEGLKVEFIKEPPILEGSFTLNVWKQLFNYPSMGVGQRKVSEMELEDMKKKMDQFIKASQGEGVSSAVGEEPEFIVRQTYMSKNDPCVCGSGRSLVGCCVTEEEWIKAIGQQL